MRLQSDSHLTEGSFEAYSLGSLPEEDCAHFEEHLLVCSSCQDHLTEVEDYLRAARTATRELRHDAGRQPVTAQSDRRLWPLAAAAMVAFAIAVVLPWRSIQNPQAREVNLSVERGAGDRAITRAPSGRRLALNLDLTEVQQAPEYRLEVVNGNGSPVWAGLLTGTRSHLRAELPVKLAPGIYWVRLYVPSPAPLLLREYGLQVL